MRYRFGGLIFGNFTVYMKEHQYINNIIDSFFNYCLTTDCFYLYRGGEVRLPSFLHIYFFMIAVETFALAVCQNTIYYKRYYKL